MINIRDLSELNEIYREHTEAVIRHTIIGQIVFEPLREKKDTYAFYQIKDVTHGMAFLECIKGEGFKYEYSLWGEKAWVPEGYVRKRLKEQTLEQRLKERYEN